MNLDNIVLGAIGVCILVVAVCLGLIWRDRRRAGRRLADILSASERARP